MNNSLINTTKWGVCCVCGGEETNVVKSGKELFCLQCNRERKVKKQLAKQREKNQVRSLVAYQKEKGIGESLANLIQDADALFSKYIRLKYANSDGIVKCFTCPKELPIAQIHNGHYIHRTDMATRFMWENCRPQCPECNSRHNDDPTIFRDRLEEEDVGITEKLLKMSREVYSPTISEMKELIIELRVKIGRLQMKIK